MPKGRHLKPQFFTDKNIVTLSPLARLLYQGLWCYAEDCGHLDDEPIELKMRILPVDNCDVDELLGELVGNPGHAALPGYAVDALSAPDCTTGLT